jgi:hypothetical protein
MIFDPKSGSAEFLSMKGLGIEAPRGVCDIPGTPCIAITGDVENFAIVDLSSGKRVGGGELVFGQHAHAALI